MASAQRQPGWRIGELSRRVGVSDHVLRAWETRYGLLNPSRSTAGYRLYSEADADRIRRMRGHLAEGLSAAEAARAVLTEVDGGHVPRVTPTPYVIEVGELSDALRDALDAMDEPAAQAVLDRLLAELSVPTVLRDVVLPYLQELGVRWQEGTASVAQEHFASFVIRGRLAGLARGWGSGQGPRAVLACPPHELHDLALMVFGIVLNRLGWRIDYLGTSTPIEELARAAETRQTDLIVLSASVPEVLEPLRADLADLAERFPMALAGGGISAEFAAAVGARHLLGDPVTEAEGLAQ
ncbi:MAG TPA: MerR family transcriptional regulator [Mycobacteriales bacterium]|nr:MerR family transcriptional regulator [Mycobacteriales bacterium]